MGGLMNMYDIAALDGVKKSDTIPGCIVNMDFKVTANDKGRRNSMRARNSSKKVSEQVVDANRQLRNIFRRTCRDDGMLKGIKTR